MCWIIDRNEEKERLLVSELTKVFLFVAWLGVITAPLNSSAETITTTENPTGWILRTQSSVYQLAVAGDGIVIPVYYGSQGNYTELNGVRTHVNPKVGSTIRDVPFRGGYVDMTPAVEVIFADHTRDTELIYEAYEILELDGFPCLRVDLKDPVYGLRVSSHIRVLPQLDILEKWLVLKNVEDKPILVENAQSGSVYLPRDEYDLVHLAGRWGQENLVKRTRLTQGVKTIQTRSFRNHENPPWFAVGPAEQMSETGGSVWFGSLAWSGNWRIDLEQFDSGNLQIIGGINFGDTAWTLDPEEEFTTPKIVFGFASDGLGGASHRMHEYILDHVMRKPQNSQLRPVLYNSWYATTFNVNEEQQLALAKIAKEIGVELFVIDDGWFKGRNDDHAGLGDWTVDEKKFPNGLQPMIQKINDLGLDFGIWVEPEMVNPDSDLFRAHPDWTFYYPNRTRHESRNQLMLNLARRDVCDYLLDSLSRLLSENNIKFIKWDRNRPLSDPGWPSADPATQREAQIRFVHNLYHLIAELEKRFPDVLFEVCSGGGGRTDLGIFSLMDQAWTSDNTDPVDRLMIQHGFLHAFPAKLMVAWVTDEDWHRARPSLKFRFHSSMAGVLGVGTDLTRWSQEEREQAAEMIDLYKEIRPLVQNGVTHRLLSPFDGNRAAVEYVTPDGDEAVVFLFNTWETLQGSTPTSLKNPSVRLRGLDPNAEYLLSIDRKGRATGNTLMNIGLPWFLNGNFSSAIVRLQKTD
ncbi:MAG: alpha-galactosidase [Candidatus Omnitrophota bacterium]|nr:MAG: alpha-galactosidase [Candidatus Omnitrophota bacterium]